MDALNNGDFLSRDVLFKKSARWQHENEFRLIHSDLADDDHDNIRKCNYSDEAIECIIFGFNASEDNINKIRRIFIDKNIKYEKIVIENHSKHLRVEQMMG